MIRLKKIDKFIITEDRHRWMTDEDIDRYIGFTDNLAIGTEYILNHEKEMHFEIYDSSQLVGDVRFILDRENTALRRAEMIIIIGKRNLGYGTKAFPLILETCKKYFDELFCIIHKSNFRSLKLFKNNGFIVEDIHDSELYLTRTMDESE
jgi:RimJ/RimL family protein N-acetyltransferase